MAEAAQWRDRLNAVDGARDLRLVGRAAHVLLGVATSVSLSVGLGAITLGRKSLWDDEGASVVVARLPLSQLVHEERLHEANMTAYYVLLHWWIGLGTSETVVRTLSVILAAAAVVALFLFARHVVSDAVAALSALLLATAPFFVQFAQTARGYSLLVAAVTMSTLALVLALERPTVVRLSLYGAAIVVGVYAHLFALLVLLVHAIWVVATGRFRLAPRRLVVIAALIVGALFPEMVFAATRGTGGIEWIPPLNASSVLGTGARVAGGSVLAPVLGVLALLGALKALRSPPSSSQRELGLLLVMWMALPPVLAVATSLVRPVLVDRYLLVSLPPALILAAWAIVSLARPRAWLIGAVVVGLALCGVAGWYRQGPEQDWREAATRLAADSPAGGIIVEYPTVHPTLSYYLQRHGVAPSSYQARGTGTLDQAAAALHDAGSRTRAWMVVYLSHGGAVGGAAASAAMAALGAPSAGLVPIGLYRGHFGDVLLFMPAHRTLGAGAQPAVAGPCRVARMVSPEGAGVRSTE